MGNAKKNKYASEWDEARKKVEEEKKKRSSGNKYADEWEKARAQVFADSLNTRLEGLESTSKSLYGDYSTRFFDKDGNYINSYRSDTGAAFKNFNTAKTNWYNESKAILEGLTKYEKYFDADYVKSTREYLTGNSKNLDSMYKAYKSDNDYFSQWGNENAYNKYVENSKKAEKFNKMTIAELEAYKKNHEGKNPTLYYNSEGKAITVTELITKKKYEKIDTSPKEVNALIEEYTELEREYDERKFVNAVAKIGAMFNPSSAHTYGSSMKTTDGIEQRMKEIAGKLNSLDSDWENLVAYNRIRRDEEYYQPVKETLKNEAAEHPVVASVASVLAAPSKAFGVVEMVDGAFSDSEAPLNPNSLWFMGNTMSNTTRETVMENYDWVDESGRDWFDTVYSTGMSTADTLLTTAMTGGNSWAGGVAMGLSAASDTAQQVAMNGGSKEQALITGLFAGINEMVWEKISIGNFKALTGKGIKNLFSLKGITTAVVNTFKSAGVNYTEEAATEAANLIVDYYVNGGLSDYAQAYEHYLASGYDDTVAREKARNDMLKQVNEAGFGGFLQGIFMGSAANVAGGVTNTSSDSEKTLVDTLAEERIAEETQKLAVDKAVTQAIEEGENEQGGKFSDEKKETIRKSTEAKIESGEIELSSETLSKEEVSKIKKAVKAELKDGKIDLAKIEEVLTPDLTKQINELKEELANTKDEQKRAEIEAKIRQLEGVRSGKLKDFAKENKYLSKAVYEKVLGSKQYEYDDSKVTDEYEKTVRESAKKYLDNSTKSQKYVNAVAKMAKDRKTRYIFMDNKRLSELGDLVARDNISSEEKAQIKALEKQLSEAKTKQEKEDIQKKLFALKYLDVGGFVRINDNGVETVVINVDSKQSMYSVAGHETKHILEKYGLNEEFNKLLFKYAKAKGDLDAVKDRIKDIYKNQENVDIDSEVAAELVGKYLFEDEKFLETLMKNKSDSKVRQVIDKIKELIDDLVVRFKGTEQEKQLREVQKKFIELYNSTDADIVGETTQNTDIEKNLYSLGDNLENVGKILYDNSNPLAIVNRAKSNNNSSINWVYKSEIFSVTENKQFHEKISEINQGSQAFDKNSRGEYMLPIGNKIVFTDGNYDSPYIREIVEVFTEYSTEFEDIKECIYNVETGKSEKYEEARYVQNTFGKGRIVSYTSRNNGVYEWENGKRKGKTRGTVVRNYLNKQYRTGNDKQSPKTQINDIAPTKETSSTDGVFSNAEKTKYSLGLDAIETKYKDKTDYLFLHERNDTVSISNMVVKEAYRNQGIGTQILNDVIAYADENGKTITLTPTTEFGTENRLKKWYKANGFVENKGRNADLRLSDTMYRLPKKNTKYSLSYNDNQYLEAVNRGDNATAQSLVDEVARKNGYTVKAYHGTARGDRVGNVFLPERATSGPMAFFTDNKEIAENYSKSKQDTSIAYDPDFDSYETQFRIKTKYQDMPLYRAWGFLPFDARNRITKKAGQLREDWDGDYELILDPETNEANGGFQWQLKEARGNTLLALNEQWLNSGTLFNEENRFLDVLEKAGVTEEFKKIGMDTLYFKDPKAKHEKVYDTFLKITNPFDTASVNKQFVDNLVSWYENQDETKYVRESADSDLWDKNNIDAYDFAERLESDIENNTFHAWTSIPDSVTDYLKELGYDGIKDLGGKGGGVGHTVWIPFYSEQIKSAEAVVYDDNGDVIPLSERFNEENKDIRYSLSKQGETDFNKSLQSIRYNSMEDIAPVKEVVEENAITDIPDDFAPLREDEANAMLHEQNDIAPLTDADIPPEVVAPIYDGSDTKIDDTALKGIGQRLRETLSLNAKETKAIQEVVQKYSTTGLPDKTKIFDDIKEQFGEKSWKVRNEEIAEVKRTLKGFGIKVSDSIKSDIPDYSDWKKKHQGRLNFSEDGLTVDDIYMGLSVAYPGLFPEEITNPTDQLLRMAEIADEDIYISASQEVDNDTIQNATDIIYDEVNKYKENELAQQLAEEQSHFYRGITEEETSGNSTAKTVKERIADEVKNARAELLMNQQLRDESQADYEKEISRLQSVYNAKRDKNTKTANKILRRIESLQRMKNDVDADYSKRISDIEARIEKLESKDYATVEQRKTKQQEYKSWVENLIGDTSTWVDKKLGISYKTNTLHRNLRDIVRDANGKRDIAKADAIYDELQGKYNHNEAELNRESNQIKKTYADLKINSAEDTYIQMLGEFRHNPDTTLTEDVVKDFYNKHKDKIDEAKVDKVIEMARATYDDLIARVNTVLYEQGMKEIPYRKGYFPHFTDEKQGVLAKLFNWKTKNNEIPTDIAGLTEMFNPERSWQSFNKRRLSDKTDYSFMKGLDTYVQGSLDWIYHIEDIQKRRAVENHIRYIHSEKGIQERIDAIYNNEEYDADQMQEQIDLVYKEARNPLNNFITDFRTQTNTLAGKKSSIDRGMEELTNRKVYSTMTNISNRVTANMVGGSVSSALTNFIPITQSWGQVSPISSLRAMGDTIKSTIRDDGTINKSDFLTNRLNASENLYKTTWDKIGDKVGWLMEAVDNFTSQTVWRSKYLENISKGMSENAAIKNADQFAENVMAGRSRGNMPTIFDSKNPLVKTLTAFQLEVNNQYGYMFKDMPQDMANESKAKLVKGYATMFIGAYVYNALYSSLTGRDAAFDPIGIIIDFLRDLGVGDDEEEEEIAPVNAVTNLAHNVLEEVPFVGGLLGGGRVPISSAMPYGGIVEGFEGTLQDVSEGNTKTLTKEWLNPVYYVAMPMGGGQIKKSTEGLSMFSDKHPVSGSYTDSGNLRFPVEKDPKNILQAFLFGQYANKNAREYFDNDYAPLNEKQIKEYAELEAPIQDYWKYREGLKKLNKQDEKVAYINNSDFTGKQKDILKSYLYDEDGYKKENPEKYAFLENEGIGFLGYKEADEETQNSWSWAFKHQDEYRYLKENGVNPEDYSVYRVPMLDFDDEGDKAYTWAFDNPEKATVGKVFSSGVKEYRGYTGELSNIKADKDENGKSISGSRKEKVLDYINSLDIDYGGKLILYKREYEADDTYNYEIVEYLNNREDITYDEMVAILTELGFSVDSEGWVTW